MFIYCRSDTVDISLIDNILKNNATAMKPGFEKKPIFWYIPA